MHKNSDDLRYDRAGAIKKPIRKPIDLAEHLTRPHTAYLHLRSIPITPGVAAFSQATFLPVLLAYQLRPDRDF